LLISHYSWTLNQRVDLDPSDYVISTAGALSSFPSLKTLAINVRVAQGNVQESVFPPLRDFKNLCTLSVSCSGDIPREYCEREITTAINASPSLANLSISTLSRYSVGQARERIPFPLQCFLQTPRSELVQLEIKHVPLPSAGIREILPHKLQQLSVFTAPGARDIEFDWRRLWSALQETGIALSVLKVAGTEYAMDEMFTYLLSYTGLRELQITNLRMDTQVVEDEASQIFWDTIIPHHRENLTVLSINCEYRSEWCYGPRAAAALWQCSSLRDLTITVCRVDSSWAEARLSRAREENKIEFHGLAKPMDGMLENCGVRPADNGISRPSPFCSPWPVVQH
jgi:hypothetical protein